MNASIFPEIFPGVEEKYRQEMIGLLQELERFPNSFYSFIYGHDNKARFHYVSPAIEKVTGHPYCRFTAESGLRFFWSITPPSYRPMILEQESICEKQAKDLKFDMKNPFVFEIYGGLLHSNGREMKIRDLVMTLEFTQERDILYSLCFYQNIHFMEEYELESSKADIGKVLCAFKEIYVQAFPEKYLTKTVTNNKIRAFNSLYVGPEVTNKEHEILQLLGNGYSSKEIASMLSISFHTAETHRKNLLEKFEARNSAELIKKSSKVYWFE